MSVYQAMQCEEDCGTCRRRSDSFCLHVKFARFLVVIRHGLGPFGAFPFGVSLFSRH